eukprot:SAG25_NODE_95_length_15927_cov_8.666224_5_plen_76_part_00
MRAHTPFVAAFSVSILEYPYRIDTLVSVSTLKYRYSMHRHFRIDTLVSVQNRYFSIGTASTLKYRYSIDTLESIL